MADAYSSRDRACAPFSRVATGAAGFGPRERGADVGVGGWTAQRVAVVERAGGVCARCGAPGADTAFRGWDSAQLLAAHTRCVVGLGPTTTPAR
jgi:hypothetical protein